MKRPLTIPAGSRRQHGSAAVELAVLLPVLVAFLIFPFFFARYYWHYTVAQKAAQDAARYLSTITAQEMRSGPLSQAAAAAASEIAMAELAELNPGHASPSVSIYCDTLVCSGVGAAPLPQTVKVHVAMDMFDLSGVVDTGQWGKPIRVDAEMRYAGN